MVNSAASAVTSNEKKLKHRSLARKIWGQCYIWFFLLLMYVPILVLIASSFTNSEVIGQWNGFSFDLYARLFHDEEIGIALGNTIILALTSGVISTILGTMGAIGTFYSKKVWKGIIENTTQIPVVNAEIVIALSLTVLFVFCGNYIFGGTNIFSFWTLLAGHVILSLPFVYLSVKPKLQQMDPDLEEAALDLGCTPFQAFTKVVIHEIMPGIISGALMAFTMSLDDFVISYFVTGSSFITLPVEIYNYTKKPIQPKIYALFTLMFAVILVLMVVMNLLQARSEKRVQHGAQRRVHG